MTLPTELEQAHGDEVRDALRGDWWIVEVSTIGRAIDMLDAIRVRALHASDASRRARKEAAGYPGWPRLSAIIAIHWRREDE